MMVTLDRGQMAFEALMKCAILPSTYLPSILSLNIRA